MKESLEFCFWCMPGFFGSKIMDFQGHNIKKVSSSGYEGSVNFTQK